jgi:hypothetical protein
LDPYHDQAASLDYLAAASWVALYQNIQVGYPGLARAFSLPFGKACQVLAWAPFLLLPWTLAWVRDLASQVLDLASRVFRPHMDICIGMPGPRPCCEPIYIYLSWRAEKLGIQYTID